jgi:hypothetical protein
VRQSAEGIYDTGNYNLIGVDTYEFVIKALNSTLHLEKVFNDISLTL